ncbi:MAG: hypothetical protein EOP84_14810, partial [Verrucomicrobiaceae bacterium]
LSNNISIDETGGTARNWTSATLNLTGVLSGSGNLNITDNGVTTLGSHTGSGGTAVSTAASTLTGKVIVNSPGTLGITGDRALGAVPTSFTEDSIQLGSGGTLVNMTGASGTSFGNGFDVTLDANRGVTLLTGGGKVRVGYNKTFTINGAITGGGSLTKTDNGTLVVTSANTYTGATAVAQGFLRASSLNSVSGGTPTSSLGAPTTVEAGTIAIGATTTSGTLVYTGTGEITDRVIDLAGTTGSATIEQAGTGLLRFTSASTATGIGNKTLTFSGSTSGTGEFSGAIVNGPDTSVTSLAKTGTSTWTLTGTNTYSGNTTLSGGVLSVSNIGTTAGGNLGTTGTLAFNSGALQYTGGTVTTSRNMTIGGGTGGTLEITGAGTNFTTTGTLSGGDTNRYLTKTGAGTLTLSGITDNSSGRVTLNAGTLVLDKASSGSVHAVGSRGNADYALVINGGTARLGGSGNEQIYNNSSVSVNAGGTFDMNAQSEGFATLTNSGTGGLVTNNSEFTTSTLTLGLNNGSAASVENSTFSGVIADGAGAVALTKTGTGTQILSGINTYTGPTLIEGGTLLVTGSISGSSVEVKSGGTLGGNGSVGFLNVKSGGTIAPGFGILTAVDTMIDGGTLTLEIGGTTAGTGYSQLKAVGSFSLIADTPLTINLGVFDPADGVDQFTIVSNDLSDAIDTTSGLFSFGGSALTEGAMFTVGTQAFTISYAGGDGNDVVLAAVPEP